MVRIFALVLFFIFFSVQLTAAEDPEDLKKFLEDTSTTLATKLTEVFYDRADFHPTWPVREIDSLLMTVDGNVIQLKDLRLTEPDISSNSLKLDLGKLDLRAVMKLKDFTLEGTYEIVNNALLLPIAQKGKVSFTFKDVKGIGRDGILVLEDSFALAQNYDFDYTPDNIVVKASFCNSLPEIPVFKTAWVEPDKKIVPSLWPQISYILSETFNHHLRAVMEEQSVKEVLKDKDVVLRERSKHLVQTANKIMDSFISSANDVIVSNKEVSIALPSFSVKYEKSPCYDVGVFQAEQGFVKDLSSLRRTTDMSCVQEDSRTVVYGHLNFEKFKFGFKKYRAECGDDNTEGYLTTEVESNTIFVKISFTKTDQKWVGKLEKVNFVTVSMDRTATVGKVLYFLPLQFVHPWTTGWFRGEGLPVLEKTLRNAFEKAIEKINYSQLVEN